MKRLIISGLILFLLAACSLTRAPASTPAAPTEVVTLATEPAQTPTAIIATQVSEDLPDWNQADPYRINLLPESQDDLALLEEANQYRLVFSISENFDLISGYEALYLTNRESVPLTELYFHLFPNYNGGRLLISDVRVEKENVEFGYQADETVLEVILDQALAPGESLELEMDFTLEIPTEMGGNYGLFGYFDDVLVLDTFYPMLAIYDEEGWNNEKPGTSGDVTYLDASFYQVRVTAPADLVLAASGVQVSQEINDDEQVTTFVAGPARDFYLAGSTRYQVWRETVGGITVNSYAFPEDEAGALLALDTAGAALEIFSEQLGAYPYSEFDVIGSPMLALGIEYPGIVGIALGMYDEDLATNGTDRSIFESVVAHEVGHQWFYNMVGNDQVGVPWLDEAVVQYITGLYYEERYNSAAAASYRSSWDSRWNRVDREEIPIGMPATEYTGSTYSPIVYGRGPYFLMALKTEMGAETFDTFLKTYVSMYTWENSSTEEFRQLAEQVCTDCDIEALFEEWVYTD